MTHNHPVDTAELEAHKITAALKCKARETIQPIPMLYLKKDRNIEELKRRFDTITLEEYLSGVSAHTNL